ncbi:nucleoside deaminase [Halorubrum kocurii]|uniref:CMP/dCMP deaminase zinc-binding protein n=1 Tax=Halorubrum kocurii JCM 14978 TaxID=1230456 RepID=M0P7V9_9EURY|nr:nucleoside deaminase [Halorubrum kocurii]EMA65629.1 CMP/dCMP deaminase zinc-binding protein [Halorubrum kocurii JCM 14978]
MTDPSAGGPGGGDGAGEGDPGGGTGVDPTDREYVDRAIDLAEEAVETGNTPFGALLVLDGEVVREARNETVTDDDLAAHPELALARWAGRELDADERARCTMYASTEPCPMCATGIHYAGIGRVVFGVAGETLDALTGGVVPIPCAEVIRRADGDTAVEGPVAEAAAMALHESVYGES